MGGNDKCSWCKSKAVPSACHSRENAKHLPPPNFICAPLDEPKPEEAPEMMPVDPELEKRIEDITIRIPEVFLQDDEDTCNAHSDEGSCKAETKTKCSWCKSRAVPSACHSLANAKRLPPPNFICDPLSEEPEEDQFKQFDVAF